MLLTVPLLSYGVAIVTWNTIDNPMCSCGCHGYGVYAGASFVLCSNFSQY